MDHNYVYECNPQAAKTLIKLLETHGWIDFWRTLHPLERKYSWSQRSSSKFARLDFFIGSEELLSIISKAKIEPKWKADHAPVSIKINVTKQQRGKVVWKFNNSLLIDKEFKPFILKEIEKLKSIYAATPYHPDFITQIPNKDLQLNITYTLFWDTLMTVLRGEIIAFSSKKKKKASQEEDNLMSKINLLAEKELRAEISEKELNELEDLTKKLEEIRKHKLQGTIIRSRARWVEYGERSSKYFLNLENRNYINKSITEIKISEKESVKDQSKILKLQEEFYEKPI